LELARVGDKGEEDSKHNRGKKRCPIRVRDQSLVAMKKKEKNRKKEIRYK